MSAARALRVVESEAGAVGWAALMARDVWRESELPHGDASSGYRSYRRLRFDLIGRPWLRAACKAWAKDLLLAGRTPSTVAQYVSYIVAFDDWLDRQPLPVDVPCDLTREVIEAFLLELRTCGLKRSTQLGRAAAVARLLDDQRDRALRGMPATTVVRRGELPRHEEQLPRGLSETVFGQVIDPANLAKLRHEHHRTVILVMAFTGMRKSSIVTLSRDALQIGSDGHPYLRYRNVKFKREAMLPICPQLHEQLERHEAWLQRSSAGTPYLLPQRRDQTRPMDHQTVRNILHGYVKVASIRHDDGRLASDIHPHLFRHHLGTSLINDGVPLPVVAKLLDHTSLQMTARYARIHDETLRREVMRWMERVNVRGERIALPFDGPEGEAAWMKERIARAKQALPNGYCGLPLIQTCPHPNACLSCANFLTDASFRTIHEQQLAHTQSLRARAHERGHARQAEVLQRDADALTRILEGLDAIAADAAASNTGEALDLIELAERQR